MLYFFMVAPPPRRRRRSLSQQVSDGWFFNSPRKTTPAFLHCNLKMNLQEPNDDAFDVSFRELSRTSTKVAREQPTAPQGVPAIMHLRRAPSPSPQPAPRPALADPSPTPPAQPHSPRSEAQHRSPRDARLPTRSCPSLLILALYSQHVGPPTAASCVALSLLPAHPLHCLSCAAPHISFKR